MLDAESYYCYAAFLERAGDKVRAEAMFREALRLNDTHVDTLKAYGDLLSDQQRHAEAEAMYLMAREQSRRQQSQTTL